MSFQDFGKNNSHRRVASATLHNHRPGAAPTPSSNTAQSSSSTSSSTTTWGLAGVTSTASSTSSIAQISETLTQYQVGNYGYHTYLFPFPLFLECRTD